jgi:hypothetical protein
MAVRICEVSAWKGVFVLLLVLEPRVCRHGWIADHGLAHVGQLKGGPAGASAVDCSRSSAMALPTQVEMNSKLRGPACGGVVVFVDVLDQRVASIE